MSERDALVEKFKKMAAKEGLTLSDQEAAEYAAEWNAMQGGSTPAATRAAPPPAAKPPPKPTNAAQKGDASTPPKGGPKGTVTQKAPVVAREPDPVMLGPVAPPAPAKPSATVPTGSSAFMPSPGTARAADLANIDDSAVYGQWFARREHDRTANADIQRGAAEDRETGLRVLRGAPAAVGGAAYEGVTDFLGPEPAPAVRMRPGQPGGQPPASAGFQPSPASARELDRDRDRLAALNIPNAHSMSDARVAALMATPAVQKALAE